MDDPEAVAEQLEAELAADVTRTRADSADAAPRGFDPACLFLLEWHFTNLFERADARVGHEDDWRCKGCRQIVKMAKRKGHWEAHKRSRRRAATNGSGREIGTMAGQQNSAKTVAAEVLKAKGEPMHAKEITEAIIATKRTKLGQSNKAVVGTVLKILGSAAHAKDTFVKVGPGIFGLIERGDKPLTKAQLAERRKAEKEAAEPKAETPAEPEPEPEPATEPQAQRPAKPHPKPGAAKRTRSKREKVTA